MVDMARYGTLWPHLAWSVVPQFALRLDLILYGTVRLRIAPHYSSLLYMQPSGSLWLDVDHVARYGRICLYMAQYGSSGLYGSN